MIMPNMQPRRQNRSNEDCQIDIKKTRSGTKIRFRGRCTKEHLDLAKEEAKSMPITDDS